MKFSKIFFLSLSAASVSITACKKIEIKPDGSVETIQAITRESDVKDVLNAAYSPLAGSDFYGGRLQKLSEYLADQANGASVTSYDGDIVNYKSSPNGGTFEFYKEPYYVIQRSNKVIESINLVTSSQATRDNYVGQAKFLRGMSHFELVRLFAQPYGYSTGNTHPGIVIRTKSEQELGRARNSVDEVYTSVLNDLREAQNLLPSTNGIYPTKWAAKGYLARVFFQMNKFDSAYKYANEVIAGSTATFASSNTFYLTRFNNPVSSEAVFYLVNDPNNLRFGALRNDGAEHLSLALPITASTYSSGTANSTDLRKNWYTNTAGILGINKYKANPFVLPVLHITELKLIRAESAAELNTNLATAVADINDITNRAYGGTLTALLPSASAATIKSRVRAERKLEMIYESGDRLQQIKRIGAKGEPSVSHGGAPWNCNGMLLQFPASEFNVNANFIPNVTGGCL
ncbi:MAG: RagB/SusD family nutrient uptake outer membrane protein [Ferruginibacter sp.]